MPELGEVRAILVRELGYLGRRHPLGQQPGGHLPQLGGSLPAFLLPALLDEHCDLIWLSVGEAVRRKLEELMQRGTYTFQSDFAKKYIAKGEVKGKQDDILAALEERFGAVPGPLEKAVCSSELPRLTGVASSSEPISRMKPSIRSET